MKITCKILVFDDRVTPECFSALKKICPEVIHNGVMRFYVPPDHPEIPKVVSVLQAHGLKMRPNAKTPALKEFIDIEYRREFDDGDLSAANYLLPVAQDSVGYGDDRTPDGVLKIDTQYLKKRFRVGQVAGGIVVPDAVREQLEKQGFKHLKFRQCKVIGDAALDYEDFPIWEITSDLVLPAASPDCKFCDCYGGPEYTDPAKGCVVDEGLYVPSLFRYRAGDLGSVEPFDVAHTREAIGFKLTHHPLIVSQRFYQFCKKQKFKLWWYPVLLDA